MYDLRLSPCFTDREKVVAILLGLLEGGILGEECLDHLSEIVERGRWQRVKPV